MANPNEGPPMKLLNEAEVRELLRQRVELTGSQAAWAREHGVNQSSVAKVILGRRKPAPKIVAQLGLERVDAWRERT